MKTINELISELKSHPDFMYAQVFCKSDVVDHIIEEVEDETGEELHRPSVESWVKQNSHMAIEKLIWYTSDNFKYGNPYESMIEAFKEQFLDESN